MCVRSAGWGVRRLGRVMRWGVYVCTLGSLILCVASYWPEPRWSREFVPAQGSVAKRNFTEVILWNGWINIERYPDYQQMGFSSRRPGVHHIFEWRSQQNPSSARSLSASSYITKGGGSGGAYIRYRFHTLWPCGLFFGISLILWFHGRITFHQGHCTKCDYSLDGLTSTTCPECGATITHD